MGYSKELTRDTVRDEYKKKYRKDCSKEYKEKRKQSFLGKVLNYRDSVSLEHIITCVGFGIGVASLAVGGLWVPAMTTAAYTLAGMAVGPLVTAASLFTYAAIKVRREANAWMKKDIKDGKLCIDTAYKKRLEDQDKTAPVTVPKPKDKIFDLDATDLTGGFNNINPISTPVLIDFRAPSTIVINKP